MRNVLFTGGWAHDFASHAPLLARVIDSAVPGLATETVDRLDDLTERLTDDAPVDLVTIYACRFRMLDARYSPAQRAEWAMEIPAATRRALAAHVASGGPLLAVHTAAVCFDDWPEWGHLLGGSWSWERSWHPPPAEMTVRFVADHPITTGIADGESDGVADSAAATADDLGAATPDDLGAPPIPPADGAAGAGSIRIVDERYTGLEVHDTTQVLGVSPDDADIDQPVLWCHESAGGRVVYDSLGHDTRSLTHAGHVELIRRSVQWLVGADR